MEKKITIRDVAKAAHVSVATVSRVLNNNVHVNSETKKRVTDSIEKLGFIPSSNAQSLKTSTTHTIGFLASDISNVFHSTIARGIEDIVNEENYAILLCSTGENPSRELSYLKMLVSKNIDALIINPTGSNAQFLYELSRKIPTILLNRRVSYSNFDYDFFDTNGYKGSYLLTKQLLTLNHRRIFVISGPNHLSNAISRFQGFTDAMKEAGITVDESYPYVFDGQFSFEGGVHAIDYLCSLPEYPTAILSQNNLSTQGALYALKQRNISIPEDISIVSHDELSNWDFMSIRPTHVIFNTPYIAEQIGHRILARMKTPSLPSQEFIYEPIIIPGNSVTIPTDHLARRGHF